ncbi:hypothetical protein BC936DRAFT_143266 [Jimgerdemannia flammicorona]|uniref:Uncharacterized protein n=1 Tax=Jimgerdemannia flammicorona TaxID=994334 RepID=A0A432ZZ82_9FUNG|nr:hypothetical protein BC936DRAFT_143266 [Jimgerdemannia flammicorona]
MEDVTVDCSPCYEFWIFGQRWMQSTMAASNTGKALYLYRHVQTRQVLVSLRQNMKYFDETARPLHLRKDHWAPLAVVTGFDTDATAQAAHDALLWRTKERQRTKMTSPKHINMKRRLRVPIEQNQLDESLISLREALEKVTSERAPQNLSVFWEKSSYIGKALKMETMDVMVAKYGKENAEKYSEETAQWPAGVYHHILELKRSRMIENPELRVRRGVEDRVYEEVEEGEENEEKKEERE